LDRNTTLVVTQILKDRTKVLRLAICLLLMFSLPVMAQGTCTGSHIETRAISAQCVQFDLYNSSPFCNYTTQYIVEYTTDPPTGCDDKIKEFFDQDLILKRFNQGATIQRDRRNVYEMGVNPATLTPEGLDLDIFPSFEISAQLALKPSLSYSPDHVKEREGLLEYGPPKQWRNHYGEIVVMLGETASIKVPIGSADPFDSSHPRDPVAQELQVFFINASGQQVNFYPDPDEMDGTAPMGGQVTTWYSEDGGYRLVDLEASSQNPTGPFDFELKTPEGLTYTFQPYTYNLDAKFEVLSRHFRVDKIQDRYDNYIDIQYRDEETGYSGQPTIQPRKVMGYANGTPATMLQELTYTYDNEDRLSTIEMPGFDNQTQTYTFHYLNGGTVNDFTLPDNTTTNRLKLNNLYNQPLASANNGHEVLLPPLAAVQGYLGNRKFDRGLFLNFDDLGFVPELGIDFSEDLREEDGEYWTARYRFRVEDSHYVNFTTQKGLSRQSFSYMEILQDSIAYRFQSDPSVYPDFPSTYIKDNFPDFVQTDLIPGASTDGEWPVEVFPRLKEGDLLAWVDSGNDIQAVELQVIGQNPIYDNNAGAYAYPLEQQANASADLFFIRKDQRQRIAEIEFPNVPGSSKKHMLLKYDEHSVNHAEIEQVLVFDELSGGATRLLSQTDYKYEQVLVQAAAEDLEDLLLEPAPTEEWSNCIKSNRLLEQNGSEVGVEYGIGLLRRHELVDMLRHKRTRYYEPGIEANSQNNIPYDNYRDLETFYGGAWQFALMGYHTINEVNPTFPTVIPTCDEVEWGIAQKPFSYTWQINPDGSALVFDLSADGVGLDPVLAYANQGRRVFKTYRFDTQFMEALENSTEYSHLIGNATLPLTPYYQYAPSYVVNHTCGSGCTIPDLEMYPTIPVNRALPEISELFDATQGAAFENTKAFEASIQLFEPIPLIGYDLLTRVEGSNSFKKLALGSLHGSIHGDENKDTRYYYRVSAVFGIDAVSDGMQTCEENYIDTYLRGAWTSTVSTKLTTSNPVSYNYTVPWTYGGDINANSCFYYIHLREKTNRLRPHAQIQLQKLSGLAWNDTQNILDLAPNGTSKVSPWVVEASRYSNGGYLGEGSAQNATDGSGESLLTGVNLPTTTSVKEGDYFYYERKIYQIVAIASPYTMTIKPEIGTTSQGLANLKFYRFYDPDAPATFPYLGYDHFGNNAFKATYKRGELKFPNVQNKANGDDEGLVPDFFDAGAVPFTLSLNDSTASGNQDLADWNYFGRVTRMFETGLLPLNADDGTDLVTYATWHTGMLTDQFFPASGYRWMPSAKTAYFLPATLTGNISELSLDKLQSLTPSTNQEDHHSRYFYYCPSGAGYPNCLENTNPMSHGRVSHEWMGKSNSDPAETQATVTRSDYDGEGWLSVRDAATFAMNAGSGTAIYGMRTLYETDPAMGLVTQEQARVFDAPTFVAPTSTTPPQVTFSGSGIQRGKTETDYDLLGRKTLTKTYDAEDQPFGNVVTMAYPTQTQTITLTKDSIGSAVFQTEMTFVNGQGQPRATLRQRGGETNRAYAVYSDYDIFGRPLAVSAEREELDNFTNLEDLSPGTAEVAGTGYTRTVYNLRSEPFGSVVYDNGSATQSTWALQDQDASGNLISLSLRQVPGENLSDDEGPDLVDVKRMLQNEYGLLKFVEDFQINESEGLWTDQAESVLLDKVDNLSQPLAKAEYSYDRMNKVITAKVGTTSPYQTRHFFYDQRDRLRRENHPEMPGVTISYEDFDHFDNPQKITHKDQTQTLRHWGAAYDTAGNMLSHSAGPNEMTTTTTSEYVYNYQASFSSPALTPAAWPGLLRAVRHSDPNGGVFLYWNSYDVARGLQATRSLYHNRNGFPGESATNLTMFDMTGPTAPTTATTEIEANYSYDSLGRLETLIYPAVAQGMAEATEMDFSYHPNTGLLTNVFDTAFKQPLPLVQSLSYGVGDQLENIALATPDPLDQHRLTRNYDTLNRLDDWGVDWESAGNQSQAKRYYDYDHGGRIRNIGLNENFTKGFTYRYDGLGQISAAKFQENTVANPKTWTYGYDALGFGNLVSLQIDGSEKFTSPPVDLTTNQMTIEGVANPYSPLGELAHYRQNGTDHNVAYNDLGRLAGMSANAGTDLNAQYHYDHAGMRVYTDVTGAQTGLEERRTLYFYDADGMVLCEWVSEKDAQSNWTTPRWDRSYIYLAGKSSITYEYDAASSSVPTSSSLAQPTLLLDGQLTWDETTAPYEVEIADDRNRLVRHFAGLPAASLDLGTRLKYGKYHVRFKGHGATWGDWQDLYHMNETGRDLAGEYGLDRSGDDRSDFRNHLGDLSAIGFTFGQYFDALDMNAGEKFTIENPHQFQPPGNLSTLSLWLKIPPLPNEFTPYERGKLWDHWHIALWVGNDGNIELKPKGQTFQSASLKLTPGSWSHIAVVYGDATTKVYIDGQLGLDAANITTTFGHGDMSFGNINNGFEGLLDRLRVFNRALTSTEIQAEATP